MHSKPKLPCTKMAIGGASKWISVVRPVFLLHQGLNNFQSTSSNSMRVSRLCSASEGANLNKSPEHWSLRWFLAGVNFVAICYDFRCVWASLGRDELISNRQACKS